MRGQHSAHTVQGNGRSIDGEEQRSKDSRGTHVDCLKGCLGDFVFERLWKEGWSVERVDGGLLPNSKE
jgi:hypothetical protein